MSPYHWLLVVLIACGFSGCGHRNEYAAIVASPYRLAKYVETQSNFAWEPIWEALKIEGVFLPRCEASNTGVAPCSSELITVVDPFQVIVLLEERINQFQVILRYWKTGPDQWRFSGAYAPNVKYFHPEHRVARFGGKPFLIVTQQGNAGSGLSSKVETWIDLTRKELEPVLSFTAEGQKASLQGSIGREVSGTVVSFESQPLERVTVGMSVRFRVDDNDNDLFIGERRNDIVFTRLRDGYFHMDEGRSTASYDEVGVFYDDLDSAVTDEEFLRFNFRSLAYVARKGGYPQSAWLSRFLKNCADNKEARELKRLLPRR